MITQENLDAFYAMEKDIDAEFEKEESLGSDVIKQDHDGMEIVDPINSSQSQTQYGEQP
tara:strand:- start:888 stop:1064 length:177 start_codon:yes stop_codon:yes gene_type:complete